MNKSTCPHCNGEGVVERSDDVLKAHVRNILKLFGALAADELVEHVCSKGATEREARRIIEILLSRGEISMDNRLRLELT